MIYKWILYGMCARVRSECFTLSSWVTSFVNHRFLLKREFHNRKFHQLTVEWRESCGNSDNCLVAPMPHSFYPTEFFFLFLFVFNWSKAIVSIHNYSVSSDDVTLFPIQHFGCGSLGCISLRTLINHFRLNRVAEIPMNSMSQYTEVNYGPMGKEEKSNFQNMRFRKNA